MKKIIFVFITFSLIVFACKKKNGTSVEPIYGIISSLQFDGKSLPRPNNKLEILGYNETNRCKIPQYGIQISQRAPFDSLVETISLHQIPMSKIGKIPLKEGDIGCDSIPNVIFTMNQARSFLVAAYIPLKNYENYINIKSFDDNTKEVKGNLRLTIVNDSYSQYPRYVGYRDTIIFESGDFTVRLQ